MYPNERYSPVRFETRQKWLPELLYLQERIMKFLFFFFMREIEFYRYFDMWSPIARSRKNRSLYRQHHGHFLSIISSSIPAVNIGIPPSISQFK